MVDNDPVFMFGIAFAMIVGPLIVLAIATLDFLVLTDVHHKERQRRLLDLHMYALKLKEQVRRG